MESGHAMTETKQEKPNVKNLTNRILTLDEYDILPKGLQFTPTPQKSNFMEI